MTRTCYISIKPITILKLLSSTLIKWVHWSSVWHSSIEVEFALCLTPEFAHFFSKAIWISPHVCPFISSRYRWCCTPVFQGSARRHEVIQSKIAYKLISIFSITVANKMNRLMSPRRILAEENWFSFLSWRCLILHFLCPNCSHGSVIARCNDIKSSFSLLCLLVNPGFIRVQWIILCEWCCLTFELYISAHYDFHEIQSPTV